MKRYFFLILMLLAVSVRPGAAMQPENQAHGGKECRMPGDSMAECGSGSSWCKKQEGSCSPEMRGRCGKRRGDWYGARQPVTTAAEARTLLQNYFTGQEYTISEVTEKKWGFKADIFNKSGAVIDRVMIDKRSGRIRSLD
jgi:hypothetical protein